MPIVERFGRALADKVQSLNFSTVISPAMGGLVIGQEVARQLGEVLNLEVKAFAVPRAAWAEAFEQFGIPKGRTGPAEDMFEAVNAGWMDLGAADTEHVEGRTSARDVFEAAQNAAKA